MYSSTSTAGLCNRVSYMARTSVLFLFLFFFTVKAGTIPSAFSEKEILLQTTHKLNPKGTRDATQSLTMLAPEGKVTMGIDTAP